MILILFLDKLTKIIDEINEKCVLEAFSKLKNTYASEYMPPYFAPKDLEKLKEVRCKLREKPNRESFDENLKGFSLLSIS